MHAAYSGLITHYELPPQGLLCINYIYVPFRCVPPGVLLGPLGLQNEVDFDFSCQLAPPVLSRLHPFLSVVQHWPTEVI